LITQPVQGHDDDLAPFIPVLAIFLYTGIAYTLYQLMFNSTEFGKNIEQTSPENHNMLGFLMFLQILIW